MNIYLRIFSLLLILYGLFVPSSAVAQEKPQVPEQCDTCIAVVLTVSCEDPSKRPPVRVAWADLSNEFAGPVRQQMIESIRETNVRYSTVFSDLHPVADYNARTIYSLGPEYTSDWSYLARPPHTFTFTLVEPCVDESELTEVVFLPMVAAF